MFCLLNKDKKNENELFFYVKEFEIGYVLIFSSVKISTYRYYKANNLSFMCITVYMHIVFHRRKKSFFIMEIKLRHYITLQKKTKKAVLIYITVTVSRGTYLGIDHSTKRKFVSSAINTWKSRMFDTDFVICLCLVFAFSGLVQFHYHSRDNNVS